MVADLPSGDSADILDEVVIELKKLADNYKVLDGHVESLNKHTVKAQLDVEMLLNRSTNNNKHLQAMSQLGQSVDRVLEMVQQLDKQQESDKRESERLKELDREILAKERRAAALDADYQQMKQKLSERHSEFVELQKEFQDFQISMNQQLKNTMGNIMVSSGALLDDATAASNNNGGNKASSKMQKITSMLREKYNLENGSRRVVSTDSFLPPSQMRTKKKYVLSPSPLEASPVTPERPSFNSDNDL